MFVIDTKYYHTYPVITLCVKVGNAKYNVAYFQTPLLFRSKFV